MSNERERLDALEKQLSDMNSALRDLQYKVQSLENLMKTVEDQVHETCMTCGGTGTNPSTGEPCAHCDGL